MDTLSVESGIPDPWEDSRFEWLKALSGAEAGKIGERLARSLLGGEFVGRNEGYDLRARNGRRVEVKLCRRSYSKSNVWSWKQIRRDDEYDDLCLIAVEPDRARVFVVPVDHIPASALSNQHGRKGDGTLSQIAYPKDGFPEWLLPFEIK